METFHTLVRIHPEKQLALYVYTLYFLIDGFIRCFFAVWNASATYGIQQSPPSYLESSSSLWYCMVDVRNLQL